ncbi:MAG: hypothetical protein WC444_06865 [Candidatus Paceibacterota bacterium]
MNGTKFKVKGLAIEAGMSRNKIMYTAEELEQGSQTLAGVTIIKDHEATTDNSIGKVEYQTFKNGQQHYEGWVEEDGTGVVQKIRDRRLKVSVGAMVKQLVRENEDDEFLHAKGIHYLELSTTPTPGVASANIQTDEGKTSDVVESLDLKQLQSTLTEAEITDIIEKFQLIGEKIIDENTERGVARMEEENKLAAEKLATEKLAADKVAAEKLAAEKVAAEKIAAEKVATEKAAAEKAEADKVAAEKLAMDKIVAEKVATENENTALKSKVQEMEKMLGATKGKVDNGTTTEKVMAHDNYAVETSKSGKLSLFMVPNADGSFPIKR